MIEGSGVRSPRVRIMIDGRPTNLVECTVNVSRHARSDTFQATTPLAATGRSMAYWASVGPVDCVVQACNDEDDGWVELLTGQLDRVAVRADPRGGVRVEFAGRDKTAKLLDTRRTKRSPNKKSSAIVKDLAAKHGLKAEVDETDDDAGKQHTEGTDHLVDNDTDWNTIARLAEREGAFLYLKGDTIYFKQPGNDAQGFDSYPIRFTPPSEDEPADGNVMDITFVQNVHLNRGVKQTVRSFHTRKEKSICTTKQSDAAGFGDPLEWIDVLPGLTDSQVEKIAAKRQIEKQRHEMQVQIVMPGDVDLDPRRMLTLSGTDSAWDQDYHIDTISHAFSPVDGYTMSIAAKNKKGGEGGQQNTGAGGGDDPDEAGSGTSETQGPNRPTNVPVPPSRSAGL